MIRRHASFLLTLVALLLCGCAKVDSPAERMAAADKAMQSRDYAKALELYAGLAAGGEGITDGDRFKATLESVKCKIHLDQAVEAITQFRAMYATFDAEMNGPNGYKNALAVLNVLDDAKFADAEAKVDRLVDVLETAKEKHPEREERFKEFVKKLIERGVTPAALAKLKELGYA